MHADWHLLQLFLFLLQVVIVETELLSRLQVRYLAHRGVCVSVCQVAFWTLVRKRAGFLALSQVAREHVLEAAAEEFLHQNFLIISLISIALHVINQLAVKWLQFRLIGGNLLDLDFSQDLGRPSH